MNTLPVRFLLSVVYGIFILGQHLLLTWHLGVPSLDCFYLRKSIALEGGGYRINNAVDFAETFALAELLATGEAPWDFPVKLEKKFFLAIFSAGMTMG